MRTRPQLKQHLSKDYQAIANPRFVENQHWTRRFRFDLLAKRAHQHAQIFSLFFLCRSPGRTQQMSMSQHAPGEFPKLGQHDPFLWRQVHLGAAAAYAALEQVDLQITSVDDLLLGFGCQPLTKRGANAGDQFVAIEWLGDIIVGAKVEGGDLLLSLVAPTIAW